MNQDLLDHYRNQEVVIDATGQYVFVGTLVDYDQHYLVLEDVDVHDLRDTSTTRELYVVGARLHGNRPNRKRVLIKHSEIVSLSALSEIIL